MRQGRYYAVEEIPKDLVSSTRVLIRVGQFQKCEIAVGCDLRVF
jgi:RNase adaptor protein for sRNA GlmZ degradation